MTVAKRRAIDLFRRNREREHKYAADRPGRWRPSATTGTPDFDAAFADDIDDDLLRLVFIACHPVLSVEARVALTLRLLGGLTTAEIARAYLVPRADHRAAHRPGQADPGPGAGAVRGPASGRSAPARLASVLEVIYLIFNEGYSATAGDDWMRPGALRGRAAARPHPGPADAGRARGARAARADGDPGVPAPGPHRAGRASRSCCSTRTGAAGTGC